MCDALQFLGPLLEAFLKLEPTKCLVVKDTWKIYLGQRDAEMFVGFHCHSFVTHVQATPFCHLQVTDPLNVFHLILFILQVYYICVVFNTFASDDTFVWTWIFETGMVKCIFWLPTTVWTSLNLFSSISVPLLWSSRLHYLNMTERICTVAHLLWCYDLLFWRVLCTSVSC